MFPISLSSKRARLALRFFTYGVMTLATVVLTILAVFYAMGYRFNQSTLSFEQGGLIQLRSSPSGAVVVVDGKVQNFSTPGRINLNSGVHTIIMQREGYRSWQKTISLAPGQLLWLNYARLIPSSVTTVPLKEYASISSMSTSPDKRWIVIQEKPDQPTMTLVDTADERNLKYTAITLPDAQLTRASGLLGELKIAEWDLSSRYFLVRHRNGATNEWLRVDRAQPSNTVNLSRQFQLNIAEAHFAGSNPNIVFARTDDVLRRFDLGANSASAALISNLKYFTLYGDNTVAYIAERTTGDGSTKQQVVGLYQREKATTIETVPMGVALKIAFGEYDNHSYLAIHRGEGEIQILRDPANASAKETALFAKLDVGKPATQILFSNNGRMIVAGADNLLTTYDLELGSTHSSSLSFLGQNPARELKWLDDFYLWSDEGDRLRIVEFDGQNDREITTVSAGYTVSLSQSGETLFSIGKNSVTGKNFLQASQLVIR